MRSSLAYAASLTGCLDYPNCIG